jgi:23S rRNA (cytosine1962-C5)-methyltransferase
MSLPSKTPALRLRLSAAAESIVRAGHPWVFAASVRRQNRPGKMGELAVIYDRHDEFLAAGLFDPDSPIRVRILHKGKPEPLNRAWWRQRWEEARARREGFFDCGLRIADCGLKEPRTGLFQGRTTGFRCINGESDGWPGLVLDRYDTTLALKLYTAAWLPRLGEATELLAAEGNRIVLRLSRNIEATAREQFGIEDGEVLRGSAPDGPVVFLESGLRFEADVLRGQKTGFFLDQRENRRRVELLAAGRRVLNLFSYSGGFSLYAARGGAAGVCSVDISPHALAAAERNFALNRDVPAVAACPRETAQADVFCWLREPAARRFDLIVLDPPALAKRASEREEAMRAYSRLLAGAMARLNRNGMLVAASCSAHVCAGDFFDLAREAARQTGRGWEEWLTTRHAADHPATFAEGEYLKCIYLRFQ